MDVNQIIEEYKKSKRLSIYEVLCNLSYSIFKFKLPKEEEEFYKEINRFCKLRIPPASNFSASILIFVIGIVLIIIAGIYLGFSVGFILFILVFLVSFLTYYYPFLKSKFIRNFASSEMMHTIIYMSISLKQVPNLEKAVLLVAKNLTGEIGKDFKHIIARFLMGEISIKDGLNEIIERWYKEAREFCEALKLLIAYSENPSNSENLIEEAIRIMHDENFERMEKYARGLKLPSNIILGLGIILPLLSLTILPLFSIFFPQIFSFTTLMIIFNLLLPTILFLIIISIITSRPLTTSFLIVKNPFEIDLFSKFKINLLLVGILITFLLFSMVFSVFISLNTNFEKCSEWANSKFKVKPEGLNLGREECETLLKDHNQLVYLSIISLSVLVFPISLILFFGLKNIILRKKSIEKIEAELPTVLYQSGYYLKIGNPLETSLKKGIERYKSFEISKILDKFVSIISLSGNLQEGLNKIIAAYPSNLLKNTFDIIIESYRKGYRFAGETMLAISKYLSSLFKLQTKIEELVSDTANNLKFIVSFLMPIIVGVGISLVIILLSLIINVFFALGEIEQDVGGEKTEEIPIMGIPFISFSNISNISFGSITFSLGLYIIEMVIISNFLIVGLESGLEKHMLLASIARNLIISLLLYIFTIFLNSFLLKPMIQSIVELQGI